LKVAVDLGDGVKREVEVHHTIIVANGKPKEIYRSTIITCLGKPCYIVFDPATGEVEVHILEKTGRGWVTKEVKKVA